MTRRSALAVLIALTLAPHAASAQNQPIVIEGGTLIDGNGGAPLPNSVVVVEGGRIKAVGTKGRVTYPPKATIIDATGKTVLPGLIDAHIHELDWFPPLFLHYGVTTVTDTANPTEWSLAQREALKKGTIKGPRLFVTGVRIDGPATPDESPDYIVHVKTPAEAGQVARDLLHQGVDLLKVYNNLTPDLLQPIVEEAHKAGTEAVGHSHDANDAIHAGLKFIEHMTPIVHATISDPAKLTALDAGKLPNSDAEMDEQRFPALVELMVKNGVFMNPTLTRTGATPKKPEWNTDVIALLVSPEYRFIPQARRDNWLKIANTPARPLDGPRAEGLKKTLDFLRMYARAGGRFITGPDSGPSSGPTNMAGLAMHIEMEALVDAGLTPMQAIMSSTKWAAELLHKDKDLGTVAAGKVADLIVIDGNPLADIRATQKIRTVMMDGRIVDTKLDPNFKNPLPRPLPETR